MVTNVTEEHAASIFKVGHVLSEESVGLYSQACKELGDILGSLPPRNEDLQCKIGNPVLIEVGGYGCLYVESPMPFRGVVLKRNEHFVF
jgi:hypothetical protein